MNMNYSMMKNLIESLIQNFACPDCNSKVNDTNAEVVWAAWSAVNLDMICPNCSKHTMIRAEMTAMNLSSMPWFDKLKESFSKEIKTQLKRAEKKDSKPKINDKVIVDVNNLLKQENINVDDFLKL